MAVSPIVDRVDIPGFKWFSGKVRDSAVVDEAMGFMVFVTTDRISAFDAVLPTIIPMKGVVLNRISNFWKQYLAGIISNDIVSVDHRHCLPYLGLTEKSEWADRLEGRTILARMAKVIPVECVVRGYISGSLWSAYEKERSTSVFVREIPVLGHFLPRDLRESDRLPQPIFTPSTKAPAGQHDENLTYEKMMINHLEGWSNPKLLAQTLKSTSLALYAIAFRYAWERGIIIADTKFEFGFINGELALIDEVLTPDSSRFWDRGAYLPGDSQPSFDKQPVRDWLTASGWNKQPPAPELPKKIVRATIKRYREVEKRFINQGDLL